MTDLGLEIYGHRLGIQVDDPYPARVIRTLFPDYVAPPEQALPTRLRVDQCAEGYRLTSRADGVEVARHDLPVFIEHMVSTLLLEEARDMAPLHAAGVEVGGRRILALGDSGAGKSSVALAWSVAGHRILGDDIVFLDGALTVRPFKKPLKAAAERAVALGVSLSETPYWQEGADEAWYDPTSGGGWADPGPVAALAFVERVAEGDFEARPLPAAECLQRLLGQLVTNRGSAPEWTPLLIELAGATASYAVRFSDSRDAALRLLDLADPGPR